MSAEVIDISESDLQKELDSFVEGIGGEMQVLLNRITASRNNMTAIDMKIARLEDEKKSVTTDLAKDKARLAALVSEA